MSKPLAAYVAFLVVLVPLLVGCGPSESPSPRTVKLDASAVDKLKLIPSKDLDVPTNYLPARLDEGRISLASPEGWKRGSRSDQYLALFFADGGSQIPRIVIKASDATFDGFEEVNAGNVEAFAKRIADELKSDGTELDEPITPMVIGETAAVRYVLSAQHKKIAVQRQLLVTQFDNRRYTLDLTVYRGKVDRHQKIAYAVLASFRFQSKTAEISSSIRMAENSARRRCHWRAAGYDDEQLVAAGSRQKQLRYRQ